MSDSRASSHFVAALARRPDPGTPEALLLEAVERLSGLSDQLRQTEADKQWAKIPYVVRESGYLSALGAGGSLSVGPMLADLVKINLAVVSIPTGATGTLQLGGDVIPNLPAGVTNLRLGHLLGATDTRTLTIAGASGPAALILYGEAMAPTGSVAP